MLLAVTAPFLVFYSIGFHVHRFDDVCIFTANKQVWPAELKVLFGTSDGREMYALVLFYNIVALAPTTGMQAHLCAKLKPTNVPYFEVFEVSDIAGHAHMVPAFGTDGPLGEKRYYFDNLPAM